MFLREPLPPYFQHPDFINILSPHLDDEEVFTLIETHKYNRAKLFAKLLLKYIAVYNIVQCQKIIISLYLAPQSLNPHTSELISALNEVAQSSVVSPLFRAVIYLILLKFTPDKSNSLLKQKFYIQLKCIELPCRDALIISLLAKFALITKDEKLSAKCLTKLNEVNLITDNLISQEILILLIHPFENHYLDNVVDFFKQHTDETKNKTYTRQIHRNLEILDSLILLLPSSLLKKYAENLFDPILIMLPVWMKKNAECIYDFSRVLKYGWLVKPIEKLHDAVIKMHTEVFKFYREERKSAYCTNYSRAFCLMLLEITAEPADLLLLINFDSFKKDFPISDFKLTRMYSNCIKQLCRNTIIFENFYSEVIIPIFRSYKILEIPRRNVVCLYKAMAKLIPEKLLRKELNLFNIIVNWELLYVSRNVSVFWKNIEYTLLSTLVAHEYQTIQALKVNKAERLLALTFAISELIQDEVNDDSNRYSAQKIKLNFPYRQLLSGNQVMLEALLQALCLKLKTTTTLEFNFNRIHLATCQAIACIENKEKLNQIISTIISNIHHCFVEKCPTIYSRTNGNHLKYYNAIKFLGDVISFISDADLRKKYFSEIHSIFQFPITTSRLPLALILNQTCIEEELERTIVVLANFWKGERLEIELNDIDIAMQKIKNAKIRDALLTAVIFQLNRAIEFSTTPEYHSEKRHLFLAEIIFTLIKDFTAENYKKWYLLIENVPLNSRLHVTMEKLQVESTSELPTLNHIKSKCFAFDASDQTEKKLEFLHAVNTVEDLAILPAIVQKQKGTAIKKCWDELVLMFALNLGKPILPALSVLSCNMSEDELAKMNAELTRIPNALLTFMDAEDESECIPALKRIKLEPR